MASALLSPALAWQPSLTRHRQEAPYPQLTPLPSLYTADEPHSTNPQAPGHGGKPPPTAPDFRLLPSSSSTHVWFHTADADEALRPAFSLHHTHSITECSPQQHCKWPASPVWTECDSPSRPAPQPTLHRGRGAAVSAPSPLPFVCWLLSPTSN